MRFHETSFVDILRRTHKRPIYQHNMIQLSLGHVHHSAYHDMEFSSYWKHPKRLFYLNLDLGYILPLLSHFQGRERKCRGSHRSSNGSFQAEIHISKNIE